MRSPRLLPALLAFALASSNLWAAEIKTATGIVTVEETPGKIAVFDIAAIDTLNRLGVEIAGVPENLYVPQLAGLKDKGEIVGSIFEPNLEALSALEPDLIIVGGRSSPQIDATKRVAYSIDMTMDGDDLLDQARDRIVAYGLLFDKQDAATEALAELDASVSAAREAVRGKGKAMILMTSGPKISAYGKGSRFGWLHKSLDLPASVEDVEAATHGEAISFEFVRDANPDWLIVLDRAAAIGSDEQNAKATLDNALVTETTAWKKGQVIYMPAPDFYIAAGGAQAMGRVLGAVTEAFSKTQ